MNKRNAALGLCAAVGLLLGSALGCGQHEEGAGRRELVVFAAASLRAVFGTLGAHFEREHPGVRVVFNFAGTQQLRTQLELGAAADLFAAASEEDMQALVRTGQVGTPRLFARNEPVLVVSREAGGQVRDIADLPNASRLVIGAPEVPIGRYTLEVLAQAAGTEGADFPERVLRRVVSRELNVRQVLNKVSLGEAEAGFVYRSDAQSAGPSVTVVSLPAHVNVVARYPIAPLRRAAQPELAQAFIALVTSTTGQDVLMQAGFLGAAGGGGAP